MDFNLDDLFDEKPKPEPEVREPEPEVKKVSEPEPEPEVKPIKKKGKHKKPMSEERRNQLRANLRKGRETSLKKRQAKKESKKLDNAKQIVKKNESKLEIRIRELENQLKEKTTTKKPIEKATPINIIEKPKPKPEPELSYYSTYKKRSRW